MATKKKLEKYQNPGPVGYSWSRGQTIGNTVVPSTRSDEARETQKDINARQEKINKVAKSILDSKDINDFTEDDVVLISQSTLPEVKNVLRDYRINKANNSQENQSGIIPTAEEFKNNTAALGDKLSLQRLPGVGQYIPDVLDATGGIGQMAAGLGAIPSNLKQGQYGQAALNLGLPLLTGALSGLGTTTRGQFLNNLVNPLAGVGNKGSIYKNDFGWIDEEMRFMSLPKTRDKVALGVLDDFKYRLNTAEGKKRLSYLDVDKGDRLQNIEILEDPNSYGYYKPSLNRIARNPSDPLTSITTRHEIEHGVQAATKNKNTTKIDDLMSGIELRRQGTPDKQWGKSNKNEPVDASNYKSLLFNKQNATDYFLTGSGGAEKSTFLAEVQQYMMDTGVIPKRGYTKITPEMVRDTFTDAIFDDEKGGRYLRLFNIMKASDNNYSLIAKGLNKMLSATPVVAAGLLQQNKEQDLQNFQQGGATTNTVSHRMAVETPDRENWFAFPMVDYDPATKKWIKFEDEWEAFEYHKKNNTLLPIPEKDLALYYGQEGIVKHGDIKSNPEYDAISNVLNQRNKHINWIKRGLNPENYPSLTEEDYNNLPIGAEEMKKKNKLEKYQNSGTVKPLDFTPSVMNTFLQGLGLFPNISNPTGNAFGNSEFGNTLNQKVYNDGKLLSGIPGIQGLETPLGEWGDDVSKKNQIFLQEEDNKKYGTNNIGAAAQAWALETGQDLKGNKLIDGYMKNLRDRSGAKYDADVSAQKGWNEYGKPLAGYMSAMNNLTDLQAVENLKGNKRALYDVTDEMKGLENKGIFAKEGGHIQSFQNSGAPSYPYLSGAQNPPRSLFKDRKSEPSKIKNTLDNILEAVGINTGINALSDLSKKPGLDTFYDLYNVLDAYRQGDPIKATINEIGAFIPGLSGKVLEAAAEDFTPKFPEGAKKKMKFIAKQSNSKNLELSEKYGQVYWDNPQFQKDYKKEIDKLQLGGAISQMSQIPQINQLQQALGYKDSSPFKNMLSQIINSNRITMDGVSQPLQVTADTGERRVLPPNSGIHVFQGAQSVLERPAVYAQDGTSTNGVNWSMYSPHDLRDVIADNKKTIGGLNRSTATLKAHKVIEPQLKDEVENKRKRFSGIFQQGGYPFLPTPKIVNDGLNDEEIKAEIKRHEGAVIDKSGRHNIYKDSEGYNTIGYGHLWRPVEPVSLNQEQADAVFSRDYEKHKAYASQIPGWDKATPEQKKALINLTFNMGEGWYKKFPKFTKAMENGDYNSATKELKDSLWYQQVGPRANDVIRSLSNENTQSFQSGGGMYPSFNQRVSPQDSVRNMGYNTMTYEENAGSEYGGPLDNTSRSPYGNPMLPKGSSKKDAVDWYMENTYPLVAGKYQTAMETAAAGDFAYNAGKDARIYMLDQYIKRYKKDPKGLPGRGTFNVDIKSDEWKNAKGLEFEAIWNKYKDEIQRLPEQQRRELINNGRDYYYTHILNEPDGSPNHAYKNSWFGRIHASDQYEDIREGVTNPDHPKYYDKYHPNRPRPKKKEEGGPVTPTNEYDYLSNVEKLQYVKQLKGYVEKYGFESLVDSDPKGAAFLQSQLEILTKDAKDPPVIGGDVTGDEDIVITAKRDKEKSNAEIPPLRRDVIESLLKPAQLPTNDNLFKDLIEGFKEQKSAAQREQEYKRKLQLMFAEQNRQKEQVGSNISTGRGRFQQGGSPLLNSNILPEVTIKSNKVQPIYVEKGDPRIKKYQDSLYAYNLTKSIPDFFTKNALEIDDAIKINVSSPSSVILKNGKMEDFYKVMLPILQAQLEETEKKMGPINDFIEKTKILPSQNKKVKQWSGYITPEDGSKITGKVRGLEDSYVKVFKKPTQPYLGVNLRPNINIDQLDTIQPELFNTPQRQVDMPDVEHTDYESGEMVKPYEGVPNVNVVFKKRKSDGRLVPFAYENSEGERIGYNETLTKKFQYPGRFQSGGIPILNLSKNINYKRLKPQGIYKFGGLITEGSEYDKREQPTKNPISGGASTGPMGPKDIPSYDGGIRSIIDQEKNQIIPTENLIPIQTEKGELIVLPTGDVVPVMAKKRHHQMDEDEVTDVAPEGAYILSAFGRVKIKKSEAEKVITETGVKPYKLGIGQETPTEKTLGDLMTKNQMTPAEVGKLISSRFPVIATDNPYEAAANTENKINRKPYLEGLIQLSEFDKMRKGIDTSTPEATREYSDQGVDYEDAGAGVEEMMHGGSPMYRDDISHAQASLWTSLISGGLQAATSLIGAAQQRKAADRAYRDVLRLSNQSADKQRGQLGLGAAAGILGTLSQDPSVNAVNYNPTYINQMQTRTPSQITDSIANSAFANMPTYSNLAPQQQIMASQAAWGQALKAAGDARMNAWAGDRTARNQQLTALQGYSDKNEESRIAAQNATRLNRNQQIGNVGDRTQGYFDSTATIEANLGQTQANARLGQGSAQQQAIRSYTQGINQAIGTAGAAAYDYYSKDNRPYTSPPQAIGQTPLNPIQSTSTYCIGPHRYQTGTNTYVGPC